MLFVLCGVFYNIFAKSLPSFKPKIEQIPDDLGTCKWHVFGLVQTACFAKQGCVQNYVNVPSDIALKTLAEMWSSVEITDLIVNSNIPGKYLLYISTMFWR